MGVNRTEQTLSSHKATNSRVAQLRGATLGGWLLLDNSNLGFIESVNENQWKAQQQFTPFPSELNIPEGPEYKKILSTLSLREVLPSPRDTTPAK